MQCRVMFTPQHFPLCLSKYSIQTMYRWFKTKPIAYLYAFIGVRSHSPFAVATHRLVKTKHKKETINNIYRSHVNTHVSVVLFSTTFFFVHLTKYSRPTSIDRLLYLPCWSIVKRARKNERTNPIQSILEDDTGSSVGRVNVFQTLHT